MRNPSTDLLIHQSVLACTTSPESSETGYRASNRSLILALPVDRTPAWARADRRYSTSKSAWMVRVGTWTTSSWSRSIKSRRSKSLPNCRRGPSWDRCLPGVLPSRGLTRLWATGLQPRYTKMARTAQVGLPSGMVKPSVGVGDRSGCLNWGPP